MHQALRPTQGLANRAMPPYVLADGEDAAAVPFDNAVAAPLKRLARAAMAAKAVRLRGGAAGDAIAACARKRGVDVLVTGSRGHGAFKVLVLGSVAMRVAARCDTPLLRIRERGSARD